MVPGQRAHERGRDLRGIGERFVIEIGKPGDDLARFAREAFGGTPAPIAALALTRFVDDEKPLWADLSPQGVVEALGEGARRRKTVTCGLYGLTRKAVKKMADTINLDLQGIRTKPAL